MPLIKAMVNIFFTDWDPKVAAKDSCDSYVVKIPVEVGLLLSAIHWRTGYAGPVASGDPLVLDECGRALPAAGPYSDSKVIKSTSETYGWLAKSSGNYEYAVAYGLELIEEYKRRYRKTHRTEGVLLWLKDNVPDIPSGPLTVDVGLAMPEEYKNRSDPTGSYKKYVMCEKFGVSAWKHTDVPDWYKFVYTDGAATGNGKPGCRAGYAVWFGENDPRNFSDAVRENPSNQTAELMAVKKALELMKDEKYTVVTDSQYVIKCLTEWIHAWRKNGWKTSVNTPVKHRAIIESAADLLGDNRLVHVRSHMPEPDKKSAMWQHWNGNRQADLLAVAATIRWHPHPENDEYVYTTDVELAMGYPLKHAESGNLVGTVDDESVKDLTNKDVKIAARLNLIIYI